ncbi:MAG: hypothetical protein DWQ35_15805 [Planctomycetota bacterium]|nr:MAG: hypothetical protein DWQ35_15805 [Planctomycetota bacterium]REK18301.1 MAG: hypothetical protein DWQ42_20710 [Planctomycetota bacterium]REK49171.1 MAG: hypothetical protein DWQ46_01310 [Planctomycetota bacterium]
MSPDELKALLTSMAVTAQVVEAIDDPTLQCLRGWDLKGWSYVPVPWGVRFTHSVFAEEIEVKVEILPDRRGHAEGEA